MHIKNAYFSENTHKLNNYSRDRPEQPPPLNSEISLKQGGLFLTILFDNTTRIKNSKGVPLFFFLFNSDAIKLKKNIRFLGGGLFQTRKPKKSRFWAYSGGGLFRSISTVILILLTMVKVDDSPKAERQLAI